MLEFAIDDAVLATYGVAASGSDPDGPLSGPGVAWELPEDGWSAARTIWAITANSELVVLVSLRPEDSREHGEETARGGAHRPPGRAERLRRAAALDRVRRGRRSSPGDARAAGRRRTITPSAAAVGGFPAARSRRRTDNSRRPGSPGASAGPQPSAATRSSRVPDSLRGPRARRHGSPATRRVRRARGAGGVERAEPRALLEQAREQRARAGQVAVCPGDHPGVVEEQRVAGAEPHRLGREPRRGLDAAGAVQRPRVRVRRGHAGGAAPGAAAQLDRVVGVAVIGEEPRDGAVDARAVGDRLALDPVGGGVVALGGARQAGGLLELAELGERVGRGRVGSAARIRSIAASRSPRRAARCASPTSAARMPGSIASASR